jgi:hypothetical protein
MEKDWYNNLKFKIIDLVMLFTEIKSETVIMLYTNRWILENINLRESFSHLHEMIGISNSDLDELIERINLQEIDTILFNENDLLDEFDFIRENIHLEAGYITNMIDYMTIVTDPTINSSDSDITYRLEQYQDINISCYNQMKINNENLKELKKERRDLF